MAVKSDDIWETLGAIDTVLPNRRVILITRDFRDNLVSITGKNFGPIDPLSAALYVKERLVPYAAEYRRGRPGALHVKFSTLVNAPRQFVDEFSRHFGLAPAVDPETVISTFQFRPGKIEKWRALPPQELAWCEGVLYDELVEFGYSPVTPAPVVPGPAGGMEGARPRRGQACTAEVPEDARAGKEMTGTREDVATGDPRRVVFISWAPYCSRSDNIARELGGVSYMVYFPFFGSTYWTILFKYLLPDGENAVPARA